MSVKKRIDIDVFLDEDNVPDRIVWNADDGPESDSWESKAMFLSMFDRETEETMKLDLWTSEMMVEDMDRMMYHSIRAMANSYFKATKNNKLASAMQQFAQYFGEESGVIPKDQKED